MNRLTRKHRVFKTRTLKQKNPKTLKRLAIAFAIVLVSATLYIRFLQPYTSEAKQRVQLESTVHQLQQTQNQLQQTETKSKEEFNAQQQQLQETQKKLEETEKALQAKRSTPTAYAAATPTFVPSGDKQTWLSQSGIPEQYWWAVDWIVSRESGWKPCAYNPGYNDCSANPSSACGLVQQFPCHKIPGDWRDPVAALKWQYQYVTARYGGYPQAVAYWQVHGNY